MSFTVHESHKLVNHNIALKQGFVSLAELAEKLPHGSGIDCAWDVWIMLGGSVKFYNSYHIMNENGMYCGWKDFHVKLFQHKKRVLNPLNNGKFQALYNKGDWDFKVVGLSGKLDDVGDWVHEGVSLGWNEFDIGKMGQEIIDHE